MLSIYHPPSHLISSITCNPGTLLTNIQSSAIFIIKYQVRNFRIILHLAGLPYRILFTSASSCSGRCFSSIASTLVSSPDMLDLLVGDGYCPRAVGAALRGTCLLASVKTICFAANLNLVLNAKHVLNRGRSSRHHTGTGCSRNKVITGTGCSRTKPSKHNEHFKKSFLKVVTY